MSAIRFSRRGAIPAALALAGVLLVGPGARAAQSGQTIQSPSGAFTDASTATLGGTSAQVLAAVPGGGPRAALFIQVNTAGASVACNPNGTAALNTAGSVTFTQYLNFTAMGAVPNTAIQCIASGANTSITVWAFPQ